MRTKVHAQLAAFRRRMFSLNSWLRLHAQWELAAMDGEESCKPEGLRAGCEQQLAAQQRAAFEQLEESLSFDNLGESDKRPIDKKLAEQAKCPINKKLGEQAKHLMDKKS